MTVTLQHAVGHDIPLFGALAGDQWRLKSTRQFFGTEVLTDSIPVLLLCGDFRFSYGVATGWRQVGEVGRVTRAKGRSSTRSTISRRSTFTGSISAPARSRPRNCRSRSSMRAMPRYLRASWGVVDEATGALTFLATVREGARVRLTLADRDEIGRLLRVSLNRHVQSSRGAQPFAALFFSCAARKILLGTRTQEEVKTDSWRPGRRRPDMRLLRLRRD